MPQRHTAKTEVPRPADPLGLARALIAQARPLVTRDSRRTRDLANEAGGLIGAPTTREGRALALAGAMLLVKALYQLGDLAGALEAGQAALALAKGSRASDDLFGLISRMTWIYADMGRFNQALALSRRAFRMAHARGRKDWEALAYSDLGVIYDRWGKPEESSEALLRVAAPDLLGALAGEEKALACYNIAGVYADAGRPDQALRYVDEGLAAARTSHLLARRGAALAALGDEAQAEESLRAAHALAREVHDFYDEFDSLQELATLMKRQGRLTEAIDVLQQAIAATAEAPTLQISSIRHLAAIHAERGDHRAAYDCMRQLDLIREAAHSEQFTRAARALEVEFRAEIARREAEVERRKNAALRATISELERLQDDLRELSVRDPLTGIFNRRYLMAQLNVFLNQAARRGESICVAIFDIDHFKSINDRFSHQIGDEVIRQVATIALAHVRACDVLARYGGEEFVLLLANSTLAAGVIVCERLRWAVEQHDWDSLYPGAGVTVSIGLASSAHQIDPLLIDPLLRSADDQMYAAKAGGRNQVCY
ncbi:GGDEF domain-containing protein [Oscillochloris sp. ZM17-4]|uniref:tetratricopeptide repeat-containing diguanylate cyclase n=1 Tax=Oscillochloris sp. ZM17-4 TaxID=2866714 RepID=UPI001C7393FE|nr:GGDEF domain-containing protein [Oscillochloris sp. ZM17-4]MBX0328273.1 GGDEF domain-containing protein [Oscillochloris sp. ZM17-4]